MEWTPAGWRAARLRHWWVACERRLSPILGSRSTWLPSVVEAILSLLSLPEHESTPCLEVVMKRIGERCCGLPVAKSSGRPQFQGVRCFLILPNANRPMGHTTGNQLRLPNLGR